MEKKHTLTPYDNVTSALRELNEIMEATLGIHCYIITQSLYVQGILRDTMKQLKDTEQTKN